MTIHQLPTPALLLDIEILERNLRRMQDRANRLGVALRPHIKTHKNIEIAEWQRELGAKGITVSTLTEAEYFAAAGFNDITWAFPIPPVHISGALNLLDLATVRVLVDSREAASLLERECWMRDRKIHVWLKVDCGHHRVGVDPHSQYAFDLARSLAESDSVIFDGILTHGGQSYLCTTVEEIRRVAATEKDAMTEFAGKLRAAGISAPFISIGSTPTMTHAENLDGITEIRPGNYVFYDYYQAAIGSCSLDDCALTVWASVISHQPGASHFVSDAGALALSKDPGPTHLPGHRSLGMLFDLGGQKRLVPGISVQSLSQEHGKIASADPSAIEGAFRVGDRLRILENHSCLTAAQFDWYHVVRGEEVVDKWKIFRERG
jgi:D-serine deaminase-like pyridoxal phosphate-dependent protein